MLNNYYAEGVILLTHRRQKIFRKSAKSVVFPVRIPVDEILDFTSYVLSTFFGSPRGKFTGKNITKNK